MSTHTSGEHVLKPCPFCGGEAQLNSVDAGHSVSCFECGVETFFIKERYCGYAGESKVVAVASWNERKSNDEHSGKKELV